MQVGQFPASAANSLIQGYCDDFVSLAAVLAQTLEQISMRGIKIDASRASLQRIENGMRNLAEAIHELLERGKVDGDLRSALDAAPTPPATPAPARAATAPAAVATTPRAAVGAGPRPALGAATQATGPVRAPAAASMRPAVAASAAAAQRPAAPAGENLSGTSQSMPLLSVFQFLGRMRKAGVMRVRMGTEDLLFELMNGCITATASSQCPHQEQLDELLVERGACAAEALDPVVGRVPPAQTERFAEAALAAGAVTEAQVFDALALQQNRRYTRVCRSQDARYEFVEGARQKQDGRLRPPPLPIA